MCTRDVVFEVVGVSDKERIVLYVSEPTAEAFRNQVAEMFGQTDGFASQAGEMALREWCDNDRAARIEDKLDRVLEEGEGSPSETESERERQPDSISNSPSQTAKRAAKIAADLPPETWVDADIVEAKIGKHAGESYKTLKKYRKKLIREGELLPSPVDADDKYATSPKTWVLRAENSSEVSLADINEFAGRYEPELGENWYLEALPDPYIQSHDLRYDEIDGLSSEGYRRTHGLTNDDPGFR